MARDEMSPREKDGRCRAEEVDEERVLSDGFTISPDFLRMSGILFRDADSDNVRPCSSRWRSLFEAEPFGSPEPAPKEKSSRSEPAFALFPAKLLESGFGEGQGVISGVGVLTAMSGGGLGGPEVGNDILEVPSFDS